MLSKTWGEMRYANGYKAVTELDFLGRVWQITVKLQAYRETDAATTAQEEASEAFVRNKENLLTAAQTMLLQKHPEANGRFAPKMLLFERLGACALLLDDASNPDAGLAIQLLPEPGIFSQDEYL